MKPHAIESFPHEQKISSNDPQPAHDPNDLHAADFKSPVHCVRISNDGLVYVCDRAGDRVQVFTTAHQRS